MKMKKPPPPPKLKDNWHLALALALALISVGVGVVKGVSGGGETTAARVSPVNPDPVMSEEQMREILFAPPAPRPPTVQEEKQEAVAGHRARYDANPADPDAEPLLRAMGNLYKQTGDLENASWAFEQFLKRFPESPVRPGVYLDLAACYEQLGEEDNLTRLYLDMLKVFSEDSNLYKFAEASLHMSDLELRQRNPDAVPQPGPEGTFTVEMLPDGTTRYAEAVPAAVAPGQETGT